mgnify:FL=1
MKHDLKDILTKEIIKDFIEYTSEEDTQEQFELLEAIDNYIQELE